MVQKNMYPGMVNSPETTTTNNINESDTIIYVLDPARVPTPPNLMTLGTGTNAETVKVTEINDSAITVERGFQGIAKSWPAGTVIARNFTEYDYGALKENIEDLEANKETPAGAQAKAEAAAGAVQAELAAHQADGASHSKTARFVVGTSTAGWTLEDCDYLCDGTADDVEINNAITALSASGGEIVILDGTYNITAPIFVNKSNVSIKGNGNATVLKRMWNSGSAQGVIILNSVS